MRRGSGPCRGTHILGHYWLMRCGGAMG